MVQSIFEWWINVSTVEDVAEKEAELRLSNHVPTVQYQMLW